jgi:hypothetical protein
MKENTGITPPGLASRPPLVEGAGGVLRAYDILDQSRLYSEAGPQAIQVREVLAYLEIVREEEAESRLLFLNTIKALDVIFLNHYAEKHKP